MLYTFLLSPSKKIFYKQRMKKTHIIAVGRIKIPFWKDAGAYYIKRMAHWRSINQIYVRDAESAYSPAERSKEEAKRILAVLPEHCLPVCLDETGKEFSSVQFAALLEQISENMTIIPCFIIGGPFGLSDAVRERCRSISLSQLTLPHEMAYVFLLEQLYRAECIIHNVPYHHA